MTLLSVASNGLLKRNGFWLAFWEKRGFGYFGFDTSTYAAVASLPTNE